MPLLSQFDLNLREPYAACRQSSISSKRSLSIAAMTCSLLIPTTSRKQQKVLEVEVFELFKGDLVPSDIKDLVSRLSVDITGKLNSSLEDVFKQYLG